MERSNQINNSHRSSHQSIIQRKQKRRQYRNMKSSERQSLFTKSAAISFAVLYFCQSSCALSQSKSRVTSPAFVQHLDTSLSALSSRRRNNNSAGNDNDTSNNGNSFTLLHYRNLHVDEDEPHFQLSNFFHSLWNSGRTRRAKDQQEIQLRDKQEKQQFVLDDYLESIDRRYKRLHEDDHVSSSSSSTITKVSPSSPAVGFTSALQWLTHHSDVSEAEQQRKNDDALYVLGLADLASTKLLQRHHLPVPKSKLNKSVVIDIAYKSASFSPQVNPDETVEALDIVNEALHGQLKTDGDTKLGKSPLINPTNLAPVAVTLSKAVIAIQILRKLRSIVLSSPNFITTASSKFNQASSVALRVSGKAFTQGLSSFIAFMRETSGGKYSLQIASMMAVAIFTFAVSLLRPALSKA